MKIEEQKLIGALLARGLADQQVIEELCTAPLEYTEGDAAKLLREFFDNWQSVGESIESDEEVKLLNWHILLRHNLLQVAIEGKQIGNALAILESLAKLQGLAQVTEQKTIPLSIILVKKEDEDGDSNSPNASAS